METSTVTINKIKSRLAEIPEDKLYEVYDFVEFIAQKSKPKTKNIVKLEGIWKDLGFEKIGNLESEIKNIREWDESTILEPEQQPEEK